MNSHFCTSRSGFSILVHYIVGCPEDQCYQILFYSFFFFLVICLWMFSGICYSLIKKSCDIFILSILCQLGDGGRRKWTTNMGRCVAFLRVDSLSIEF